MGTGGGGRGKKGGSGGKKLPEDKVEMENYPNKGEEMILAQKLLLSWT